MEQPFQNAIDLLQDEIDYLKETDVDHYYLVNQYQMAINYLFVNYETETINRDYQKD